MNHRTLIATAALVFTACVNDSPMYVTGFFPLPTGFDCKLTPGEIYQYAGNRDLSTGASYSMIVDVKSVMDAELDTFADDKLLASGEQRNTIILDQVNLSYTVVPSSITLENESAPITIIAAPGSTQHVNMGLIGPKAAEKLATSLPNPGDRADVRVRFTFSGNIITGGRVVSTPATFPISFFRGSLPVCPAGQTIGRTGPCGALGGQDGTPICCDSDPSTAECD